jgi:5'(3')-deoxyribonucleotidase
MPRVYKVFVDMDGVLADFVKCCLRVHGVPLDLWEKPEHRGKFWMNEFWGMTNEEFWVKIKEEEEFWDRLEPYSNASGLMQVLESKLPKSSIYILSAPPPYSRAHVGKLNWIQKHFPDYATRTILTQHKSLLAAPDRLLIDDGDHNIKPFKSAGGQVARVARPWNEGHKQLRDFKKISEDDRPYEILYRELSRLLWKKK